MVSLLRLKGYGGQAGVSVQVSVWVQRFRVRTTLNAEPLNQAAKT